MPPLSPSLTATNIELLQVLWRSSLLLAALSVMVALGLVVRRYCEDRGAQRRQTRRKELERIMWGVLSSPVMPTLESLPPVKPDDIMLICDAALDILRPLRGEEAARIVQLLEIWPVRPHILRTLAHGRRGHRIRMLSLLEHFEDQDSLDTLKQWIGAEDFYVQLAALRALAARKAVDALPNILTHLINAKRQNATMLADVLRRFGEPALDMLIVLAAAGAQLEVRLAAIKALEVLSSLEAVPRLIELAKDPSDEIRAGVISALTSVGDMRAETAIFAALGDRSQAVRVQGAKAAGRLHLHAAAPALAGLLADPFWWVRYRAAEALYGMGTIGHSFLRSRSKENDAAGITAAQVLAEKKAA